MRNYQSLDQAHTTYRKYIKSHKISLIYWSTSSKDSNPNEAKRYFRHNIDIDPRSRRIHAASLHLDQRVGLRPEAQNFKERLAAP